MKTDTHRHRRKCECGGRGWSDAATNHGMPWATRSWKGHRKKPRGSKGHLEASQGNMALPTPSFWTSNLQICEKRRFCYLKPPSLWHFIMAALGNAHNRREARGWDPGMGEQQVKTWRKEKAALVPRNHRNSVW